MRENISNTIMITVTGVDLTKQSKLEFYVQKGKKFFQYTPEVIDDKSFAVTIPKADAMRLSTGTARVQLAYTDEDGYPYATDVAEVKIKELLKEAGYGE